MAQSQHVIIVHIDLESRRRNGAHRNDAPFVQFANEDIHRIGSFPGSHDVERNVMHIFLAADQTLRFSCPQRIERLILVDKQQIADRRAARFDM